MLNTVLFWKFVHLFSLYNFSPLNLGWLKGKRDDMSVLHLQKKPESVERSSGFISSDLPAQWGNPFSTSCLSKLEQGQRTVPTLMHATFFASFNCWKMFPRTELNCSSIFSFGYREQFWVSVIWWALNAFFFCRLNIPRFFPGPFWQLF